MNFILRTYRILSPIERKTFTLHIISQVFNGFSLGILVLQDVILKKSLGASDFEIMILSFFLCTAFLASIYGTEIVNRSSNPQRTIIIFGILGKIFLLILPFYDNEIFYIFCIASTAYFDSMMLSAWNIVFKHNYTDDNRSKLFSYVSTIAVLITLIISTIFGFLLDKNNDFYKYTIPIAGICGMLTYYNLSKMIGMSFVNFPREVFNSKIIYSKKLIKDVAILPFRLSKKILSENRPFMRFEINFFLYGMAFMVITPAIPVYLVDYLHLNYTPISLAKGLVFNSALILCTPLMGKFHGSGNPTRFCGIIFSLLALYPLVLILANHPSVLNLNMNTAYIVFAAHFLFGIGMAGISISWALSSIYYAPKFEESNYQAIHITLTGVRGLFSPALGYLFMKIFAIEYTFLLSAFLFLLGGFLMFRESLISHKS